MGLRASEEVRFARGTARKSSGCAVNHRDNDWASRSPPKGEFEEVIMIEPRIGMASDQENQNDAPLGVQAEQRLKNP